MSKRLHHSDPRAPRASRVDWVAARDRWVFSFTLTLDDIAEEFGVAVSTVRRRSSLEKWGDLRRQAKEQNLSKVASEGLKRAFENRAEAVEALLRVEYMESLSHAQQLQALRKSFGNDWTPGAHKSFAEAIGLVFNRVRISLGLPTVIGATPEEAEKAKHIPIAYLPGRAMNRNGSE